jgi:hypothetical protein
MVVADAGSLQTGHTEQTESQHQHRNHNLDQGKALLL